MDHNTIIAVASLAVAGAYFTGEARGTNKANSIVATISSAFQAFVASHEKLDASSRELINAKDALLKSSRREIRHLRESCEEMQELLDEATGSYEEDADEEEPPVEEVEEYVGVRAQQSAESYLADRAIAGDTAAPVALVFFDKLRDAANFIDDKNPTLMTSEDVIALREMLKVDSK